MLRLDQERMSGSEEKFVGQNLALITNCHILAIGEPRIWDFGTRCQVPEKECRGEEEDTAGYRGGRKGESTLLSYHSLLGTLYSRAYKPTGLTLAHGPVPGLSLQSSFRHPIAPPSLEDVLPSVLVQPSA